MDSISYPTLAAAQPRQLIGQKFGIRALAYVVDLIVMFVLLFVSGILGAIVPIFVQVIVTGDSNLPETGGLATWIGGFFLALLYFTLCEWIFGASLGKLLFGLRVHMDDGSNCTLRAAFVRGLLRLVDGFFFCLPAYFSMRGPQHKRIGDDVARTVVVRAADVGKPQRRSKWRLLLAIALYLLLSSSLIGAYWLLRIMADL